MSEFCVDELALVELRDVLRESGCRDPVLVLQDMADPKGLLDDIKALALSGADRKHLEAVSKVRLAEVGKELEFRLVLSAYERSDCRAEDLVEECGLTFAMSPAIRRAARSYCLIFREGQFALRPRQAGTEGRILKSIAELMAKEN